LVLGAGSAGVVGAVVVAGQDIGPLVAEAGIVVGQAALELGLGGGEAGFDDVLGSTARAGRCGNGRCDGVDCGAGLGSSEAGTGEEEKCSETHFDD